MARTSRRIELVLAPCKRCGRLITTTSRSLYGLDSLKAQVGVICQTCASSEEQLEIAHNIGKALAGQE